MSSLFIAHLVTAYGLGVVLTLFDIRGNDYVALGFGHSIWLVLLDRTLTFGAAVAMAVVVFIVIQAVAVAICPAGRSCFSVSWLEQMTGLKGFTPQMELDKDQTESLRALGYL